MKCRYCGKEIRPVGANLESDDGIECTASTRRRHAALFDGIHCIHCGRETKSLGDRIVTSFGINCSASPSGKHILQ